MRHVAVFMGLALLCMTPTRAQPVTSSSEYERLLKSYAAYKKYGTNLTVAEIERRLSEDRLNTVRGLVRGSLIDLRPGGPLSAKIDEIRGIWGVRPGSSQGKYQFRLSLYFKPGIRRALRDSRAFNEAGGAHVLLPGGDDDPGFTDFKHGDGPETWRQEADAPPRLQVSILKGDERTGEMDVDFDEWLCHLRPANSDIGSMKTQGHTHVALLNRAFVFPPDLKAACHNLTSHCAGEYARPYCR